MKVKFARQNQKGRRGQPGGARPGKRRAGSPARSPALTRAPRTGASPLTTALLAAVNAHTTHNAVLGKQPRCPPTGEGEISRAPSPQGTVTRPRKGTKLWPLPHRGWTLQTGRCVRETPGPKGPGLGGPVSREHAGRVNPRRREAGRWLLRGWETQGPGGD